MIAWSDILAALLIIFFCVQHSFFASNWAKRILPVSQRNYRLFYTFVGGGTLILLTIVLTVLASAQDNITIQPLIPVTPLTQSVALVLTIIGVIFVAGSLLQTNPFKFAGLLAEDHDHDLQTKYFYKFARHPMYTGAILVLGPNIFLSGNMVWILQNVIFVAYFIFGSIVEERRLRNEIVGYNIMFSRGALFPWKKQHFINLFKSSS